MFSYGRWLSACGTSFLFSNDSVIIEKYSQQPKPKGLYIKYFDFRKRGQVQ
jgi:hypothetical protein